MLALLGDDYPIRSLPFVGLVSMPAVLAVIGLKRPSALLAAGALSLPVSFLSFAGATLPLLVPGAFYLVAYGRAPASRSRAPVALIVLLVIVAAAGAFLLTASGTETRCTVTVVGPNGKVFEKQVGESRAHSFGHLKGGDRIRQSSCSEGPAIGNTWAAFALLAGTVAGVMWMSKVTPRASPIPCAC
jgi:hypothetical protein